VIGDDTMKEKDVHASPLTRPAPEAASDSVTALFTQHHERVFRVARRITGNASDAEDVLQTVFLRIMRRDEPPLRADDAANYLHRAATNASLDLLRRRKAAKAEPLPEPVPDAPAEEGVERIPGAHCYEFFAGREAFAALADEEPGTFYLTDFLARHFDRLVIRGLGLDRHPELAAQYFGNYRRLVYLAQVGAPEQVDAAREAARRLGLAFELRQTAYGGLERSLRIAVERETAWPG